MSKTVKEHLEQADQIKSHVDDANALLKKLREELDRARLALEWLKQFDAPAFAPKPAGYQFSNDVKDTAKVTMAEMIDARVKKINALLGDRA